MPKILGQLDEPYPLADAEATEALGAAIAQALPVDHVLALSGDLGTGKTTFTRGVARGLGIRQNIHSPTYSVFNIYSGSRQLLHMDAYRLSSADELEALDIDSLLEPPFLWVIEWPEHITDAIPADATRLKLTITDGQHTISRSA